MDVCLNVRPAVSPAATIVALVEERQIVVHDHVHLQDVDATRDDVRRDQHLLSTLAEAVDDGIALRRVFRTVQRRDLVALCSHALRYAVSRVSVLAEDDALANSEQVVERDENVIFVLLILAVHVELPDRVDGQLVPLQLDLVRVWRKLVREGAHVIGEGRGEKDDLGVSNLEDGAMEVRS